MTRKIRLLGALHLLLFLLLVMTALQFFWTESGAAALLHPPARSKTPFFRLTDIARSIEHVSTTVSRSGLDFLVGIAVFGALFLGSKIHVRRLDVWLQARSSGATVAFGSSDLASDAVRANEKSAGGVLR
jgi:hypothetical protein